MSITQPSRTAASPSLVQMRISNLETGRIDPRSDGLSDIADIRTGSAGVKRPASVTRLAQHDQVEVIEVSEPDACRAEFYVAEAIAIAVREVGVVGRRVDVNAVCPFFGGRGRRGTSRRDLPKSGAGGYGRIQ